MKYIILVVTEFPRSVREPGSGSRHCEAGGRLGSKQVPPGLVCSQDSPHIMNQLDNLLIASTKSRNTIPPKEYTATRIAVAIKDTSRQYSTATEPEVSSQRMPGIFIRCPQAIKLTLGRWGPGGVTTGPLEPDDGR